MEDSTQEGNQTNDRYSINYYSPIKYEKKIANTQPEERRNLKKNLFALGDRNILISSSPKLAYESSEDELSGDITQDNAFADLKKLSNNDNNRSLSDLDHSISIDIQQHAFPAQNIQIQEMNRGMLSDPHKNLNYIFISLEDKTDRNGHTKNVKSDMMVNQDIQKTFDDLLKRKEQKETKVKNNIEETKRQLLTTFYNLEAENNRINTQINNKGTLPTIYENNIIDTSQNECETQRDCDTHSNNIREKYKKERKNRKSSIFSSEDLKISKTEFINIKKSEYIFNSPIINRINNVRIKNETKEYVEDRDQYREINRNSIKNIIDLNNPNVQSDNFKVQQAETINIIMNQSNSCQVPKLQENKPRNYSMVIAAKVTYETIKDEKNNKNTFQTANEANIIHLKTNSSIPSKQLKSVRQFNITKITPHSKSSKSKVTQNKNSSSKRIVTLPSTNMKKQDSIMKNVLNCKLRNNSNPGKPQQNGRIISNKQEIMRFISSDHLKYSKKSEKNQMIQLLIKAKEECYVILVNKIKNNADNHKDSKKEIYFYKGLYQYNNTNDQIEKISGDNDCSAVFKGNDVRTCLLVTNTIKQGTLPSTNSLIMISKN